MVVYWFFFPPMSKALKDIGLLPLGTFGRRAQGHRHPTSLHLRTPVHRLRQTWLLMIFFFFLPWLLILIPLYTHEEVDWYKDLCTCTEFTRGLGLGCENCAAGARLLPDRFLFGSWSDHAEVPSNLLLSRNSAYV